MTPPTPTRPRPPRLSPAATRFWQLMLVLLLCMVSYLALTPTPPSSVSHSWDKLNHAGDFAALTLSGLLGLCPQRAGSWRVLLPLLAFGGLIEILQWFVPGRSSEWNDLLADLVGLCLGALLALIATRLAGWWQRRRRPAIA